MNYKKRKIDCDSIKKVIKQEGVIRLWPEIVTLKVFSFRHI